MSQDLHSQHDEYALRALEVVQKTVIAADDDAEGIDIDAEQWVAFTIQGQHYCVEIEAVHEIRAWSGATPLPNTADYVRGVINLRGDIVPIFDLCRRFGRGDARPTASHVVVVVSIRDQLVGLLVESVSDIINARRDAIAPIPELDGSIQARFLSGLITHEDQMVAVVTLPSILDEAITPDLLRSLEAAEADAAAAPTRNPQPQADTPKNQAKADPDPTPKTQTKEKKAKPKEPKTTKQDDKPRPKAKSKRSLLGKSRKSDPSV